MSLGEFFADESLGSWADDDFDISSISVPVRHTSTSGMTNPGYQSRFTQQVSSSSGPPYIAKLTNLPMSATPTLLRDLFESRYMKFEKCKVLLDPNPPLPRFSSQKSERKCCFAQLASHQELNKVLKWNDIFIDRLSVIISPAGFQDFQDAQVYNRQIGFDDVEDEKRLTERGGGNAGGGVAGGVAGGENAGRRNGFGTGKPAGLGETKNEPPRHPKPNPFGNAKPVDVNDKVVKGIAKKKPTILKKEPPIENPPSEQQSGEEPLTKEPIKEAVKEPPKRANPFGAAKPVDVLSKQREIEKKLEKLAINPTTFVLGHSDKSKESIVGGTLASKGGKSTKTEKPPIEKPESEKLSETGAPKSGSPKSDTTKKSSEKHEKQSEKHKRKKDSKRAKKQGESGNIAVNDKSEVKSLDQEKKKEVSKKSQKPRRWEHKQRSQEDVAGTTLAAQPSKPNTTQKKAQREQAHKPVNVSRRDTDSGKHIDSKGEADSKEKKESNKNRKVMNSKPDSAEESGIVKGVENEAHKSAKNRGGKSRQKGFANMHYVRMPVDEK